MKPTMEDRVVERLAAVYEATGPLVETLGRELERPLPWPVDPPRPRRRAWLAPAVVAAAIAGIAVGAAVLVPKHGATPSVPGSASRSATSSASPDPAQLAVQEQLDQAAARIKGLATRDDAFNDVVVDAAGNSIAIYRADAAPDRLAALYADAIPHGVTVRYKKAVLSRRQVNDLNVRVAARRAALESSGVRLTTWGEDGTGGVFTIGYDSGFASPNANVLAEFELFGPGTVRFIAATVGGLGQTAPHGL